LFIGRSGIGVKKTVNAVRLSAASETSRQLDEAKGPKLLLESRAIKAYLHLEHFVQVEFDTLCQKKF
jgi:hypothetical protein